MTPEQLVQLFQNGFVPLLTKFFLLLLIFLYGIFAGVLLRQIQLMNKVVHEGAFSPVLFTIAFLHFGAVVGLFILAIVLL